MVSTGKVNIVKYSTPHTHLTAQEMSEPLYPGLSKRGTEYCALNKGYRLPIRLI